MGHVGLGNRTLYCSTKHALVLLSQKATGVMVSRLA
jgi:hypothetical protein